MLAESTENKNPFPGDAIDEELHIEQVDFPENAPKDDWMEMCAPDFNEFHDFGKDNPKDRDDIL